MGGPGSTRWNAEQTRPVVEATPQLDARYLARAGLLEPGTTSHLTWRNRGTDVATGALRCDGRGLEVRTSWGADLMIRLSTTVTTFAGARRWLVCPSCGRRAGVLYAGGYGFACRGCLGLAYTSTRDVHEARFERLYRLHRRMGGTGGIFDAPPRPKGMHRRTYARLRRAWQETELALLGGVLEASNRRLERGGWTVLGFDFAR